MAIIYYLIFINFLIFFQLDTMILLMYSKLFVFLAAALFCQLTINTVDKDIQILCQCSTAKITPAPSCNVHVPKVFPIQIAVQFYF